MEKLNLIILQAGGGSAIGIFIIVIICFAVAIGIFLLIRALMLWYWKIDVIVGLLETNNRWHEHNSSLLKQQIELLKKITDKNEPTQ